MAKFAHFFKKPVKGGFEPNPVFWPPQQKNDRHQLKKWVFLQKTYRFLCTMHCVHKNRAAPLSKNRPPWSFSSSGGRPSQLPRWPSLLRGRGGRTHVNGGGTTRFECKLALNRVDFDPLWEGKRVDFSVFRAFFLPRTAIRPYKRFLEDFRPNLAQSHQKTAPARSPAT